MHDTLFQGIPIHRKDLPGKSAVLTDTSLFAWYGDMHIRHSDGSERSSRRFCFSSVIFRVSSFQVF